MRITVALLLCFTSFNQATVNVVQRSHTSSFYVEMNGGVDRYVDSRYLPYLSAFLERTVVICSDLAGVGISAGYVILNRWPQVEIHYWGPHGVEFSPLYSPFPVTNLQSHQLLGRHDMLPFPVEIADGQVMILKPSVAALESISSLSSQDLGIIKLIQDRWVARCQIVQASSNRNSRDEICIFLSDEEFERFAQLPCPMRQNLQVNCKLQITSMQVFRGLGRVFYRSAKRESLYTVSALVALAAWLCADK